MKHLRLIPFNNLFHYKAIQNSASYFNMPCSQRSFKSLSKQESMNSNETLLKCK